jgi:hypothetical protein
LYSIAYRSDHLVADPLFWIRCAEDDGRKPTETDCVAGHIGLEPANPSANYLIGIADNFV